MADAATLVYDIDSAAARTAASDLAKLNAASAKAAGGADKLNKSLRDTQGRFRSSYDVAKQYGGEIQSLAAKYNPALSAVYQYQQAQLEVNRAVALGVLTQQQADAALERTAAQLRATAAASQQFGAAQKQTGAHTANVFAQLNDIGVMMAAGQNPFQLALQQGTQLNQVWASMGKEGKTLSGVYGMLRGAVVSMISPMNLLTIGVIAGGAALVNWALSAEDATEKTDALKTKVDEFASSVSIVNNIAQNYSNTGLQSMLDKYGEVNAEILVLLDRQREFATNQAMEDGRAAVRALGDEYTALNGSISLFARTGRGDLAAMTSELNLNKDQVVALGRAYKDALSAQTPEQLSNAIARMNVILNQSNIRLDDLTRNLVEAEDQARQLAKSAPAASWMNAAISGVNTLIGRLREAVKVNNELSRSNSLTYGQTKGDLGWAKSDLGFTLSGDELLGLPKAKKEGGGGGGGGAALAQAEKQFQSLRELMERESMFQVAEYEKRQAQLDNAYAKKLLSEQQYQEMRKQLQMLYFGSEYEQNIVNYQMDLDQLNAAFEQKLIAEEQYLMRKRQLQWDYAAQLQQGQNNLWSVELDGMAAAFGEMNKLAGGGYDKLLRAQQIFSAASALMSTYTGAAKALELPFPQNMVAMGKVLAAGMGLVNAIKGGKKASSSGSSAASAVATKAQPTQYVTIDVTGDSWAVGLVEGVIEQIQQQTKDGRVVFMGNGR